MTFEPPERYSSAGRRNRCTKELRSPLPSVDCRSNPPAVCLRDSVEYSESPSQYCLGPILSGASPGLLLFRPAYRGLVHPMTAPPELCPSNLVSCRQLHMLSRRRVG